MVPNINSHHRRNPFISTSKLLAKHPLAGQNTQQLFSTCAFLNKNICRFTKEPIECISAPKNTSILQWCILIKVMHLCKVCLNLNKVPSFPREQYLRVEIHLEPVTDTLIEEKTVTLHLGESQLKMKTFWHALLKQGHLRKWHFDKMMENSYRNFFNLINESTYHLLIFQPSNQNCSKPLFLSYILLEKSKEQEFFQNWDNSKL